MDGADAWQQLAEQESYLWSSLQAIRSHLTDETYQKAERELGFASDKRQAAVIELKTSQEKPSEDERKRNQDFSSIAQGAKGYYLRREGCDQSPF